MSVPRPSRPLSVIEKCVLAASAVVFVGATVVSIGATGGPLAPFLACPVLVLGHVVGRHPSLSALCVVPIVVVAALLGTPEGPTVTAAAVIVPFALGFVYGVIDRRRVLPSDPEISRVFE